MVDCSKEKMNKIRAGCTAMYKDPNYASLRGIISDWSMTDKQSIHQSTDLEEDKTQRSSIRSNQ